MNLFALSEFLEDLNGFQEEPEILTDPHYRDAFDYIANVTKNVSLDILLNFVNTDLITRANIATVGYNLIQLNDQTRISDAFIKKCEDGMCFVDKNKEQYYVQFVEYIKSLVGQS